MSGFGNNHDDPRPNNPLAELMFGAYDDHDLDEIADATHWPEVLAVEGAAQWEELRAWVEQLQERFSHLDQHVVPRCWWRHNEHVEALSALRDHERSSFAATRQPYRNGSASCRPTSSVGRNARSIARARRLVIRREPRSLLVPRTLRLVSLGIIRVSTESMADAHDSSSSVARQTHRSTHRGSTISRRLASMCRLVWSGPVSAAGDGRASNPAVSDLPLPRNLPELQ